MSRFVICLAVAASLAGISIYHVNAQSSQKEPAAKVLLLEQQTATHGPVKTYVRADAVKICFTSVHGYLVARAPTWQVMVANSDDKTVYALNYEPFLKTIIRRNYFVTDESEVNHAPCLKVRHSRYADRGCELYAASTTKSLKNKFADYFVIEDQAIAPQACYILDKWLEAPFLHAVPLAFKYIDQTNGRYRSDLDKQVGIDRQTFLTGFVDPLTTRKTSLVDCSADFFDYPKNYKPVRLVAEIFAAKKQTDLVGDMFSDGLWSDVDRKKAKAAK